jgi:hypothetical protein
MTDTMRRWVLVPACALALGACGTTGTLATIGEILGGVLAAPPGAQAQVAAEVDRVDTQRRLIFVNTQDGQSGGVLYDQNTTVIYRQQQYPISALERGDLVVLHVQQNAEGHWYASRVDITERARDRTTTGTIARFDGRVSSIDHQRGTFVILTTAGSVNVYVPQGSPQATVNYFHSLRVGQDVRLEGITTATDWVAVHRFL